MNDLFELNSRMNAPEVMAMFGEARLVRQLNGRIELLGGAPKDRDQARAWVGTFLRGDGGFEAKKAATRPNTSADRSGEFWFGAPSGWGGWWPQALDRRWQTARIKWIASWICLMQNVNRWLYNHSRRQQPSYG